MRGGLTDPSIRSSWVSRPLSAQVVGGIDAAVADRCDVGLVVELGEIGVFVGDHPDGTVERLLLAEASPDGRRLLDDELDRYPTTLRSSWRIDPLRTPCACATVGSSYTRVGARTWAATRRTATLNNTKIQDARPPIDHEARRRRDADRHDGVHLRNRDVSGGS